MIENEKIFILGESDGEKVAYAMIKDFVLIDYGYKEVDNSQLYEFQAWLKAFVMNCADKYDSCVSMIVARAIDFNNCKRSRALNNVVARTLTKSVADKKGIIYTTPSMSGWEKYFFGDKIQQAKLNREKIRIVNTIYETDLTVDDLEVANAIMLGFAFSSNGLKKYKEGDYKL